CCLPPGRTACRFPARTCRRGWPPKSRSGRKAPTTSQRPPASRGRARSLPRLRHLLLLVGFIGQPSENLQIGNECIHLGEPAGIAVERADIGGLAVARLCLPGLLAVGRRLSVR